MDCGRLLPPHLSFPLSFTGCPIKTQDGPPPCLPWGAWSATISLFCSNEFGLWRRADFPAADEARTSLPLEFSVYDHGGGYCAPSGAARVEVEPWSDDEEVQEKGGDDDGAVVLHRNTSCRVQCRVRFLPCSNAAAPRVVHLRVGLPPALLSREVLPVVSLPILLVPPSSEPAPPDDDLEDDGVDTDARLGIKGCRTIYLPALGRALLCAESPGQAGIAGKVYTKDGAVLERGTPRLTRTPCWFSLCPSSRSGMQDWCSRSSSLHAPTSSPRPNGASSWGPGRAQRASRLRCWARSRWW